MFELRNEPGFFNQPVLDQRKDMKTVRDAVPYFAKLVDAWNKDKKWHESTIIYGKYHSMISILYNFGTYRLYLSLFPIASVVGRMGTLLQVCEPVCDVTENLWWG